MIIFEPGGGKNLILVALVGLFAVVIIWQWMASDPFSSIDKKNYFLSQLKEGTQDATQAFADVRNSFDQGKEEIKSAGDEVAKQLQQEKLLDETKKYLEEKENNLNLEVPENKEDCLAQGGEWKKFGPGDQEECNLFTTDAGKECSDGKECQGFCFVESAEIISQADLSSPVSTMGICSDSTVVTGKCTAFVIGGKTSGKLCID
ncbi:MAG: hypothetical protein A2406_03620 [Candidatus Komeilibacteria bacterium RIFOXYC1_FULL_37_11]|uniref:Uncharacterized protein n=1 Tax=Candidatus Komeilibacteria bacterium RIFOXYC1_FULL_37_11 TaxID=1798555 RepID=A0A1G2BXQ2_9BACT|nr:MAG: hypothetical protein A2406_03620 [Candidatus Komeilibacteria bacterium RIFOXYC1_FULL_37_11]OGY95186.1 MAG: hypothetical protein A2611_00565 [Candidatus Komeilibacteria bacterium RIFOXYD1_FULL_37_29]OGY97135.1 MAG: hypothetical protein A2543_02420 [Candidatus Komeilibacteria bacterium RIFOXYD2_FULL_37_8]